MNVPLIVNSLTFIFALAAAETPAQSDLEQWKNFKVTYRKIYRSKEEEKQRMKIFLDNHKRINRHNQDYDSGLPSFRTAVNKFSDLTLDEFNGLRGSSSYLGQRKTAPTNSYMLLGEGDLPSYVDWRTEGAVTRVKDQERCLSCWVFSAVAAVESQHFMKTGELLTLSEQNVVDCLATPEDEENCPIGWMDTAFEYIQNHGISTEESYPYEGKVGSCKFNESSVRATISGYTDLPAGNEYAMQKAVAQIGPVSVAIDSKDGDFVHYNSGVYFSEGCKNNEDDLDHAVVIVGYGEENGLEYWLVKNSWGTGWGEEGYAKIARNKNNHCGIATKASYPTIV